MAAMASALLRAGLISEEEYKSVTDAKDRLERVMKAFPQRLHGEIRDFVERGWVSVRDVERAATTISRELRCHPSASPLERRSVATREWAVVCSRVLTRRASSGVGR